ncbi:MAG: hypothetical protein RBR28_12025 [Lentimicrobium sp.]|jgi:hypothetical protein|nr:hypothetical protein [Lentimicrobium sp.]
MVKFSVNTAALTEALSRIKLVHKVQTRENKMVICECTVKTDCLEIQAPGIFVKIAAFSSGPCKFTVPYLIFSRIINSYQTETLDFTIDDGRVHLENLSFSVDTTFFNDDNILRSIQLPINYGAADLLALSHETYTVEELKFNKTDVQIDQAMLKLSNDLRIASKRLKPYQITYTDLKNMVCERLNLNPAELTAYEKEGKTRKK